ncbi:MAG: hypothetical protein NTY53_14625, partial [Kiritimatiellaeota bacterium]|nr:hypothetical protein [Kiritimatiellota bacterium]
MSIRWLLSGLLIAALGAAHAADKKKDGHTGTKQSSKLYTAPDASDPGGLRGHIALPKEPLIAAFAVPNSELAR